ncbi:hypothetical protein AMELA_G00000570 [Ameiurus melas]|uniref:Dynein axonemal light chain 4 n=1 Tax=Ameiurus melas TaxID=219545 RepID=A0A7J6BGC3_AMEME|nr:hypothetical protein AMELA_G00000570 [Ameiurus melas]
MRTCRTDAMAGTAENKKEEADYKRLHSFPLIRSAARMIKESMDKKFGSSWHVVIGEGFGFEITHEVKNLLYMFFGGSLAVCVWRCS